MAVSRTKTDGTSGRISEFAARRASDFEKRNPLICVLTDYGRDEAPYLVRSAIRAVKPDARIEDATHEIPAFNILIGAWRLARVVGTPTEAEGTIYVAVVDPGVGGNRKSLVIQTNDARYLVGPDNGLLSLAFQGAGIARAVSIDNQELTLLRFAKSSTFEGKDVFGPVAAYLANGVKISEFGNVVQPEELKRILLPNNTSYTPDNPSYQRVAGFISEHRGALVDIDDFGNIRTSIPNDGFKENNFTFVRVLRGEETIWQRRVSVYDSFEAGREDAFLLVRSSTGYLDIAKRCGSASEQLGILFGHISLSKDLTPTTEVIIGINGPGLSLGLG